MLLPATSLLSSAPDHTTPLRFTARIHEDGNVIGAHFQSSLLSD